MPLSLIEIAPQTGTEKKGCGAEDCCSKEDSSDEMPFPPDSILKDLSEDHPSEADARSFIISKRKKNVLYCEFLRLLFSSGEGGDSVIELFVDMEDDKGVPNDAAVYLTSEPSRGPSAFHPKKVNAIKLRGTAYLLCCLGDEKLSPDLLRGALFFIKEFLDTFEDYGARERQECLAESLDEWRCKVWRPQEGGWEFPSE